MWLHLELLRYVCSYFAAESYEIKMSENPLELRNAVFENATTVNTSGLTPDVAGAKQSFQFELRNFPRENGTMFYFAIRAIDDSSNVGEASNIARAAVLLPTSPSATPVTNSTTPKKETPPEGLSTAVIIAIIVCASVIIICIIVCITICILRKMKNRSPATGM